jgi:hypothetical protein
MGLGRTAPPRPPGLDFVGNLVGTRPPSRGQTMSTEDKPKNPGEEDFRETPEWHRARARRLRESGFTKMAREHEQTAEMIERRRQQTK